MFSPLFLKVFMYLTMSLINKNGIEKSFILADLF